MAIVQFKVLGIAAFLLFLRFAVSISTATERFLENPDNNITDICLGCICEATSSCDTTALCSAGRCGAFQLTYFYWVDGGAFRLENDTSLSQDKAFENCANDVFCAGLIVESYIKKYNQDCNNDNVINCYDHVAIHKLGPGCMGLLDYHFDVVLTNCLSEVIDWNLNKATLD